MSDETSLENLLHEIRRVPVDSESLSRTERAFDHAQVAHSLLREAAQLAVLAASVSVGTDAWARDDAVVVGHLVRLTKLLRWILEEAGEDRPEVFFIAMRATGECLINLRYLVKHRSPELGASFIYQSLQVDLALERTIRENIEARGGEVWPIEDRMLQSIERTLQKSGVTRQEIPRKRIRSFGGKNLKEKAEDIGLEAAYHPIFASPSRMVHGGWATLLMHHLEAIGDGTFRPSFESDRPSIQPLYALGILTCEALEEYFDTYEHPDLAPVLSRIAEVRERLLSADSMHEDFLSRRFRRQKDAVEETR